MKKLLLIPLIVLLACSLVLANCGEPEPEPTPSPSPSPSPSPTPAPSPSPSPSPSPTPAPSPSPSPTPTPSPEPTGPSGTLRVSSPTFAYESMDPIEGESFWGWSLYDPLVTWDENFEFAPALAESWTVSEDGLTWTFNIRKGVNFHNGDPVTAQDVMFSVEHFQSPDSWNPWSPYLSYNFDTMSCPDDYTFVYKTVKPEHPLVMALCDVRIMPKNYIEENGWDYFKEHPIGSGPWKFVNFTSGDQITMEANTEHWRMVPAFEKLIQYVIPEESTQIAMLKRGEVDIITGITLDRAVELIDEGFNYEPASVPTGHMITFPGTWMTDGPTSDMRVRKALAYSINYQEICDTFFHGYAEPGGRWFMHPDSWGWDDSWQPEPYDPDLAVSLLAEAGYPDAFDNPVIDIYCQVGWGYLNDLVQVIQGYWLEAGIQTEIHIVDPFEWAGMYFVPHYDEPDFPNVGAIFPWGYADAWPVNVYHSYNMYCGGVHTVGNDPKAVELYNKAVNEPNPDLVEGYWSEFMTYAQDEMFVTFGVVLAYFPTVVGPEVGEWTYGQWISIYDAYQGIQHAK